MSKKIAVYGGIGCGKSTVMATLKERGYDCLSADEINARLLQLPEYIAKVGGVFPFAVSDGAIDKARLAKVVFSDKKQLELLNSIAHPLILQTIAQYEPPATALNGVVFVETPLYLEAHAERLFDKAICVSAPLVTRIKRLKNRGMKLSDILKRMLAQAPAYKQKRAADFVIDNRKSLQSLENRVDEILNMLFS